MTFTVHASEVSNLPWKNGGGFTQELLTWPQGDTWQLRISLASIDSSGPFSIFMGVQRTFTVIEGKLTLIIGSDVHTLCHTDFPLTFDGSTSCQAQLISLKAQALNVMTQSSCITKVSRLNAGEYLSCQDSQHLALFALDDSKVDIGNHHDSLCLMANSLMWIENASIKQLNIQSGKIIACKVLSLQLI
jgi:hypothetical protein